MVLRLVVRVRGVGHRRCVRLPRLMRVLCVWVMVMMVVMVTEIMRLIQPRVRVIIDVMVEGRRL